MVSKKAKEAVWKKGKSIAQRDPNEWRRDETGKVICKSSYGTKGQFGWEVDHRKPVSKGGGSNLTNLRPLNTDSNRKKSDKY